MLRIQDDALLPTSEVLSGRSMETYDICEEEGSFRIELHLTCILTLLQIGVIFLKKAGSGFNTNDKGFNANDRGFNANDRVLFWTNTGDVQYAVVKSSSRLPDVRNFSNWVII